MSENNYVSAKDIRMEIVEVKSRKTQNQFLAFRKQLYSKSPFVDNNYILAKEVFDGKLNFMKETDVFPVMIKEDKNSILCEGMVVYSKELPDYVQLCFFESLPGQKDAVRELIQYAKEKGKERNCRKLVVGLYGHVNYGLGLLTSHFDSKNSFSAGCNPQYYIDYFRTKEWEEITLNSYVIDKVDNRLNKYGALIRKLEAGYEFKYFDRKNWNYWSKLYTDLNNECFAGHRYYYHRDYIDDEQMLKELFLFMKEDSLIFAFYNGEPAGFIMWYPDFNELAKSGERFGAKHYIRNLLEMKKIKTAKIMEFGVRKSYQKSGLALALVKKVGDAMKNYNCDRVESSWILSENEDSNSVCAAICDGIYKTYSTFETQLK